MRLKCPNQSDLTALIKRIEAHYAPTVMLDEPQHDAHVRARAALLQQDRGAQ